MSSYFKFTKKALAELATLESLVTYHDTVSRGLKLVVRPSGTKTFILYRKIKGKPERLTLGRFPDLSIEKARAQADHLNATIANGDNPADHQRSIRKEILFDELFQLYLEQYAKVHKRTWKEDANIYRLYCASLVGQKLSHINKSDIQRLHKKVGEENGIYTANRLISLLQCVFNRAIEWGLECPNPAQGIRKFKEKSRERFLQSDEIARLFKALEVEPNDGIRDYVLLSLLTGARKSNILSMRWENINFERGEWMIPITKNGESHTVPLVASALEILQIRMARTKGDWVFPGSGSTGHLVEPKKAWKKILERANIQDLRLHDLRRTLGSWQAATGANLSVIGKTLAHKNVSTTAIYARINLDPVRDAMNKATQAMFDAVSDVH